MAGTSPAMTEDKGEHAGVPAWASGGRRSGACSIGDAEGCQDETVAPKTLDTMTLDEIITHRSALADRLPERTACRALPQTGDAGPQRRDRSWLRRGAAARGGDQLRQAARLQGRVRGGAALHRRPFRKAAARSVRRRFQDQLQPRAAAIGRRHRRAGAAEEARVRRLDDACVQAARPTCAACAAPRSISSVTAPTASSNAN